MNTRTILADDHVLMRQGLKGLIESMGGYEIVGETNNGKDAVSMASALEPDLILMDITMPKLNGIEATRQVIQADPTIRIVGLSVHAERRFAEKMLAAGARGFLKKDCEFDELRDALKSVMAGQFFVSPSIIGSRTSLRQFVRGALAHRSGPVLSPREQEILQMLANGLTTKEMAEELNLSVKAVEKYRTSITSKLGIDTIAGQVKYALEEGFVSQ